MAIGLALGTAASLSAQAVKPPPGTIGLPPNAPPAITFTTSPGSPDGRYTFTPVNGVGPLDLTIRACDQHKIVATSLTLTWNGVAVTAPDSVGTSPASLCSSYSVRYAPVRVNMNPGGNTLHIHVCDVLGACTSSLEVYHFEYDPNAGPLPIVTSVSSVSWRDWKAVEPYNPFGETSFPAVNELKVSGADFWLGVGFKDPQMSSATRTLTLNGAPAAVPQSVTSATTGDAVGTLRLAAGANTIVARICSAGGTCAERSMVVTSDQAGPQITVSPADGHKTPNAAQLLSLTWSDAGTGVDMGRRSVRVNDVAVAVRDTQTINLVPGENVIEVRACDIRSGLGQPNCTTKNVTYFRTAGQRVAPVVQLTPQAEVLRPPVFDAMLSYSTMPYLGNDQEHSATLVYRSSHAAPRGMVQVDVVETSEQIPTAHSISLTDQLGALVPLTSGGTENFYAAGSGTSRLAAQFEAAHLATGAYAYTAVVRSWWSDGSSLQTLVPVRVLVRNERESPYGAGWTLQGFQRILPQGQDLVLADGDGSLAYFRFGSCTTLPASGGGTVQVCTYQSPAGESSTIARRTESSGTSYVRTYQDNSTTVFHGTGVIRYHQSALGQVHSYETTGRSTPASMIPFGGRIMTFNYNGTTGRLEAIEDGNGRTTNTTINGYGHLTTIRDPDLQYGLRVNYDTLTGRAVNATRRGTGAWYFRYDRGGETDRFSSTAFTAGSSNARLLTDYRTLPAMVLPAVGRGTSLSTLATRVHPRDLWLKVTPPVVADSSTFQVDRFGLVTATRDTEGNVTRIFRDEQGRDTLTMTPEEILTIRWTGWRVAERTQGGVSNTYEYHPQFGTMTAVKADDIALMRAWYGTRPLADSVWTEAGGKTRYSFDSSGRPLRVWDDRGEDVTYTYGPGGAPSYTVNAATVTRNGVTVTLTRDAHGRIIEAQNQFGHTTKTRWNVLNQAVQVTGALGDSVLTTWTGPLATLADANGQLHQFLRNPVGLDTARIDPRAQKTRVTYDALGRVASLTNRRGQVTSYTYDSTGRPLSVTATDGSSIVYSYDDAARMMAIQTPHTADTLRYTEQGFTEAEVSVRGARRYRIARSQSVGRINLPGLIGFYQPTVDQRIWLNGDLVRMDRYDLKGGLRPIRRELAHSSLQPALVREAAELALDYDDQDRLRHAGVADPQTQRVDLNPWLSLEYGPAGAGVAAMSYPKLSGMTGRYHRDLLGRLVSRGGTATDSAEFQYDAGGRLAGYGTISPVTQALSWRPAYSYDLGGNRTDRSSTIQAGNRVTAHDGWQFEYDADGNLTRRVKAGVTDQTLVWNAFGQLTSVTTVGSGTVTFTYDGQGRRVRKAGPQGSVDYLYDGSELMAEADAATGAIQAKYLYLPGVDQPYAMERDGVMYRYVLDDLGSVVALAYGDSVVNRYKYDPWGQAETATGTVKNSLRFTGRELDAETGLYYVRARYYDPVVGRFISEDPTGLAGGLNLYAYARNSPLNFTDPTGLFACPTGFPKAMTSSEFGQLSPEMRQELLLGECVTLLLESVTATACVESCPTEVRVIQVRDRCQVVTGVTANFCSDPSKGIVQPDPVGIGRSQERGEYGRVPLNASVTVSGGLGIGGSWQRSLFPDEDGCYANTITVGLGIGWGVAVSAELTQGNSSGLGIGGTVTAGAALGGSASLALGENGPSGGVAVGGGMGAGGSVGVVYSWRTCNGTADHGYSPYHNY
jgi:RHS repeat-associated protein